MCQKGVLILSISSDKPRRGSNGPVLPEWVCIQGHVVDTRDSSTGEVLGNNPPQHGPLFWWPHTYLVWHPEIYARLVVEENTTISYKKNQYVILKI